jgi:hypothetical protein
VGIRRQREIAAERIAAPRVGDHRMRIVAEAPPLVERDRGGGAVLRIRAGLDWGAMLNSPNPQRSWKMGGKCRAPDQATAVPNYEILRIERSTESG